MLDAGCRMLDAIKPSTQLSSLGCQTRNSKPETNDDDSEQKCALSAAQEDRRMTRENEEFKMQLVN